MIDLDRGYFFPDMDDDLLEQKIRELQAKKMHKLRLLASEIRRLMVRMRITKKALAVIMYERAKMSATLPHIRDFIIYPKQDSRLFEVRRVHTLMLKCEKEFNKAKIDRALKSATKTTQNIVDNYA